MSTKKTISLVVLIIAIALVVLVLYFTRAKQEVERLRLPAEEVKVIRNELAKPAPSNISSTTEEKTRAELSKPAPKISEDEIERIRKELSQ